MKIIITILLAIIVFNATAAAELELVREPLPNKISHLYDSALKKSGNSDPVKVWVYFTDKGVFSQGAYRAALGNIEETFTERALKRRILRKQDQLFDFHDLPVYDQYIRQLEDIGFETEHRSRWLNGVSGYVRVGELDRIAELTFVYEIRPVATATRQIPEDSDQPIVPRKPGFEVGDYGNSYNQYHQVHVPQLHDQGITGRGVTIALMDSGYDISHPAFDSLTFIAQYDFVDDDPIVLEADLSEYSHGTKVLSTLGGFSPGNLIAPAYNANIVLARTEYNATETQIEEDNWIAAAEWADSIGVDIITSSLGYFDWYTYEDLDGNTAPITVAADLAVSRGIAVFISAGNERNKAFFYITPPADGDSVIAVAAVDADGDITAFSSSGPTYDGRIKPDLSAQGSGVVCVIPSDTGFSTAGGTSFSTPITAGAAAQLLEVNPSLTPMQLRQKMIESADRFANPDNLYGYGIYNTLAAADLLEIDSVDDIFLSIGDTLDLLITASNMPDSTPVFTAENLPASAVFTDNGDRTANLFYIALEADTGANSIRILASAGRIVDTLEFDIIVTFQNNISAGPNPFVDSVSIFLGENAGQPAEISIFALNGEKVWETSADINYGASPIVWRGVNYNGEEVASGVYLVYVRAGGAESKLKLFKK